MFQRFVSHISRHRHQVLLRPGIHSLRQAPQVRLTRYRTWFNVLFLTSLIIVIRFCLSYVFTLLGRLLRLLYSKQFSFDESIMFWWSREFCYADWAETCRNLFGQELSNNSSSFCSFGTQNFHLPMYLYDYLFLTMRWNYKWGLGWKALSYSLVHRFLFELKSTTFAYAFS